MYKDGLTDAEFICQDFSSSMELEITLVLLR